MPSFVERAPAKVNLTLEIAGRRRDGLHELASLVAFAGDTYDTVTLTVSERLSLATTGPEAAALDQQNLILAAAEAMQRYDSGLVAGSFRLDKQLPVAAGIGGGSSDAAAAIRAIARANAVTHPGDQFGQLAATLGADVPVCLGNGNDGPLAAFMTGIGEKVWRPPTATLLPASGLAAVLINPRVAVSTGDVFGALAAPPLPDDRTPPTPPAPFMSVAECLDFVTSGRNDLEAPATTIAPVISNVLDGLRELPHCRLARMSGSGATCFGLFDNMRAAQQAAGTMQDRHPGWWIRATILR